MPKMKQNNKSKSRPKSKAKKSAQSKPKKEEIATLQDLFILSMKDIYDAEKQIAQALPAVIKKATSEELKEVISHHLEETMDQIGRLERVYDLMGMSPKRKPSLGIKGLIDSSKEVFAMKVESDLLDIAINASSRKIEHHEIAAYRGAIELAKLLDMVPEVAELLQSNLEQEEKMDEKLTAIASMSADIGTVEEGESNVVL